MNEQQLREHAERNLSSLVIAIEFTLISVMVGVVLFPLMDFATPILRELKFEYVPYIVSGLILILFIWSEVISHSMSFVGWPLDIFHNLLYIVLAMFLAIQMHFLQDPLGWFTIMIFTSITAAAVGYYDRRVIQDRVATGHGAAEDVYTAALSRQNWLVRTSPYTIGNAVFQAALIFFFPTIFITYHAHLILVAIQIVAFSYLLARTLNAFKAQRPRILQKAMEELGSE